MATPASRDLSGRARAVQPSRYENRESKMGNRLFIGNLSFRTSSDSLRAAFAEFGDIDDLHIAMDRETGQPRGFTGRTDIGCKTG